MHHLHTLYVGNLAEAFIQSNLQPFIHTPTAESTMQGGSQPVSQLMVRDVLPSTLYVRDVPCSLPLLSLKWEVLEFSIQLTHLNVCDLTTHMSSIK